MKYQNPYLEYVRLEQIEREQRRRQIRQPRARCECGGSGYHQQIDFYGIERRLPCAGCHWAEIEASKRSGAAGHPPTDKENDQ